MNCLIIGIAGGTGSGKSTFTNRIKDEFGDKVTVIYYDNYYRSHDDMPLEERKLINYDHPDAFETDLFMVLQNPDLRDLLDIKIFVEADADERILRRVIRDVKERGRDVEGIAKQYLTTVKPMHYIYVEPTKYMADIVLNSGLNDVVFDVIKVKIESHLSHCKAAAGQAVVD